MRQIIDLVKGTSIFAFKLYIILPLVVLLSLIVIFKLGVLSIDEVFFHKVIYWFIVAIIGVLSIKSKRFFIGFLISITLFLAFGGIEYIYHWIY